MQKMTDRLATVWDRPGQHPDRPPPLLRPRGPPPQDRPPGSLDRHTGRRRVSFAEDVDGVTASAAGGRGALLPLLRRTLLLRGPDSPPGPPRPRPSWHRLRGGPWDRDEDLLPSFVDGVR